MKEFSQEIIEIGGVEYTLFLNRNGILAWEKYSKKELSQLDEMRAVYNSINNAEDVEITDDTDPFEDIDKLTESEKSAIESYKKLFWILLRTNHKLPYSEACKLFDKACEEYTQSQVTQLEDQMVNDANTNRIEETKKTKKLAALRPTE